MPIIDAAVLTPNELGPTLKPSATSPKKYDVNLDDATFSVDTAGVITIKEGAAANPVTSVTTEGKKLVLTLRDNTKLEKDLSDVVSQAHAEMFLSGAEIVDEKLKLTVAKGNADGTDKVIEVSVSDLIPVKVEATGGLQGDGTDAKKLALKVKAAGGIKATTDGVEIDRDYFTIRLTNAAGDKVLGYIAPPLATDNQPVVQPTPQPPANNGGTPPANNGNTPTNPSNGGGMPTPQNP